MGITHEGLWDVSLWSTAKDRAEKKRQKGIQPKGLGETTRNQPSVEGSATGATSTPTKSSQRSPASPERESLGKLKPTKDSLRRGEKGFKHVLLLLPCCYPSCSLNASFPSLSITRVFSRTVLLVVLSIIRSCLEELSGVTGEVWSSVEHHRL